MIGSHLDNSPTDRVEAAKVRLGVFLAGQGLDGQLLNSQAAKVYDAAIAALTPSGSPGDDVLRKALEELRALSEKASSGPWEEWDYEVCGPRFHPQRPGNWIATSKGDDAQLIVAAVNFVRQALSLQQPETGGAA